MSSATDRRDIEVRADDGLVLRGTLDRPAGAEGRPPVVVLAHGFIGVKEHLDHVVADFCAAGLACLRYDHRTTGASDGEPRHDVDPWAQARDLRTVIAFARTLEEVDGERLGLWGTSLGGGLVLFAAAVDRRVRCVVSQVPLMNPRAAFASTLSADDLDALLARLDAEQERRVRDGGAPEVVRATEFFSDPRTRHYLIEHESARHLTTWRDEFTLRSLARTLEFDVTPWLPLISPTPLLMVVPAFDRASPPAHQLHAFASALEPKRLLQVPGDHYSPHFPGEDFEVVSAAATAWLTEHL